MTFSGPPSLNCIVEAFVASEKVGDGGLGEEERFGEIAMLRSECGFRGIKLGGGEEKASDEVEVEVEVDGVVVVVMGVREGQQRASVLQLKGTKRWLLRAWPRLYARLLSVFVNHTLATSQRRWRSQASSPA